MYTTIELDFNFYKRNTNIKANNKTEKIDESMEMLKVNHQRMQNLSSLI